MNTRHVKLHEGPSDGATTLASHFTAVVNGEIYVQDGSEDRNRFVHARTALLRLPDFERREERQRIEDWITKVNKGVEAPAPKNIPTWRWNAWIQLMQLGSTKDLP